MADPNSEMVKALQQLPPTPEQQRSRTILGTVGDALGINDAIKALSGGMTEDESQDFALRSAAGLLAPMGLKAGKSITETGVAAYKKALAPAAETAAKYAPFEYSGSTFIQHPTEGWHVFHPGHGDYLYDNLDIAKQAADYLIKPTTFSKMTPAQQTAHYFGNQHTLGVLGGDKMPTQSKYLSDALKPYAGKSLPPGPPWTEKPIEDSDIAKALAKNPAASINDVSGVHLGGPSESLSPWANKDMITPGFYTGNLQADTEARHTMLRSLPRDPQWQLPDIAKEKGFGVALHHGTAAGEDFDKFRLPEDELGVHFGSPRAAGQFGSQLRIDKPGGRVYPTAIQAQNPLRLPDLGSWEPGKVGLALENYHKDKFSPDEIKRVLNPPKSSDQVEGMRKLISDKGYDSVVYKNNIEDPGHDSYILFNQSPKDPGYVKGAKVPWAKFQDIDSANLLTGIAAGAAGVGATPQLNEYVKALRGEGS